MIDNEGVRCVAQERCALCGTEGDALHRELRDQLFGAPGSWSIRRCGDPHCALAWLDPQPLPGEVIKLYGRYFTHGEAADDPEPAPVDLASWTSRGWKARAKAAARAMVPGWRYRLDTDLLYIGDRAPGRVLEVGCGAGYFLRVLQSAGWDVVGIDFDPNAIAAARRAGIAAEVSDLPSMKFPDAGFDAIVMDNVIEHLPDPVAILAECHRVLGSGGRIVCTTPNVDSRLHDAFGPDWRGLEVPRHLYLYGARALRKLADETGFARVDVFTQPRSARDTGFMVDQSALIAERAGRGARHVDSARHVRRSSWFSQFTRPRGDFVVLVAEK